MSEFPTLGAIDRLDERLEGLIAADAPIELLDVGFAWPEGPVWVASEAHLLFSDIPRNSIYRWSEDGGF